MKNRLFILLLCCVLFPMVGNAQDWKVLFSANGGFYEDVFELELFSTNPQGHIRYTTNGDKPTAQSPLYMEPLPLDTSLYSKSDIYTIVDCPEDLFFLPDSVQHCIVIRAAVFDENDSCISPVTTNSYFIRSLGCDTHGLPAISLCADSLDLFDYERGIMVPGAYFDPLNPNWSGNYYLSGQEWERPMNVEFYELDNQGINQQAGLRTHGGNGRRFQQKGLKMYARQEYGKKRFKHRFFESNPLDSFKHLTLKPLCSSWNEAGFQDHLCNLMCEGLNVESLASRPVVLFLNGEYWGLYFIHEKPDERYLEDHFGIDIENCSIMGNWVNLVEHGDGDDFIEMMDWLKDANLGDSASYAHLSEMVDLSNFIDYQIFELFIANADWPSNNMRCWHEDNGKWRWIFYDGDAALTSVNFDVFANATYVGEAIWPSDSISTRMFRKLLENPTFVIQFKHRCRELLDTQFQPSELEQLCNHTRDLLCLEMPLQIDRFAYPSSMDSWTRDIGKLNYFISHRAIDFKNMMDNFLFIKESPSLSVTELSCYPNPTPGEMHLLVEAEGSGVKMIRIFDIMGRQVFDVPFVLNDGHTGIVINPSLSAGVYVLKVGNQALRIVKY